MIQYLRFSVHASPLNPSEQAHVLLQTHAPFSHGGSHLTRKGTITLMTRYRMQHSFVDTTLYMKHPSIAQFYNPPMKTVCNVMSEY